MFDYDAELVHYHAHLLQALDIQPGAHVLDIGCGTGQTTRAAARAAVDGDVLGLDISAEMVAQATHLAELDGPHRARFVCGDAQVHCLPTAHFTWAISRFGTMFFADPLAAFTNIASAMRPGAQLVQLVWQNSNQQEWHVAIRQALVRAPVARSEQPAFSMADPAEVDALLAGAGFSDIRLLPVNEPVFYGADAESALHAIRSLKMTDQLLDGLDEGLAAHALDRLRNLLEDRNNNGVWFDSHAWLVTARCR